MIIFPTAAPTPDPPPPPLHMPNAMDNPKDSTTNLDHKLRDYTTNLTSNLKDITIKLDHLLDHHTDHHTDHPDQISTLLNHFNPTECLDNLILAMAEDTAMDHHRDLDRGDKGFNLLSSEAPDHKVTWVHQEVQEEDQDTYE